MQAVPPAPGYNPYYYATAAPAPARTSRALLAVIIGAAVVILLAAAALAQALGRPSEVSCTGANCGVGPPTGTPLPPTHLYTSSAHGYSVEYTNWPLVLGSLLKKNREDANGIGWVIEGGQVQGSWPMSIDGTPPGGRSAQAIADGTVKAKYPAAAPAYQIPGAMVGLAPGYGSVYDLSVNPGTGSSIRARVVVLTAVRNGVAITALGVGPYKAPSRSEGHPNPSNTWMGSFISDLVELTTFRGDVKY